MGLAHDAEAAVIGCILIEPDLLAEATARLRAEDFQHPLCRGAFEAAWELCCIGKPVDPLTVLAEMGDTAANREGLLSLARGVPTTANFSSYADIVVEQRQRRTAAAMARQLTEALDPAYDLGEPLPMAECSAMAGRVLQAFEGREDRAAQGMDELFADFDERQQHPPEYFRTGIGKLDNRVHICGGQLVIVAGRPSTGKTALTLQMALHMAARHRVVYFSLETSSAILFDRALAHYAGVPLASLKGRNRTSQEQAAINRARAELPRLNIQFVPAAGLTVAQIRAKAVALRAEVIVIDYLGIIKPASNVSRYEAVTGISLDLHTMAQTTGIAVIALSQLNRSGSGMAALRESGQIEQDADVILMLSQPDVNDRQSREISVEKNKEGETGAFDISFFGDIQRFGMIDHHREEQTELPLPPASQADFVEIGGGEYL